MQEEGKKQLSTYIYCLHMCYMYVTTPAKSGALNMIGSILTPYHIVGNFSQDLIFVEGRSLPFCGFIFHGGAHSRPLQLNLFLQINFLVRLSSVKIMRIGLLENFPLYGNC